MKHRLETWRKVAVDAVLRTAVQLFIIHDLNLLPLICNKVHHSLYFIADSATGVGKGNLIS
jgi:hypothetical protein